ncbi:MAG: DUF4252 domain-containing protein [Bacteroidales bacterium]|nr:DUF4252 domain-containing protein [Bacteroidales bacterium]
MKRLVLILSILLTVPAWGATTGKTVSKSRITSVISECRLYDGTEMVNLGRTKTAALKGLIRLCSIGDRDAREALKLMRGIHGITVLDFENCTKTDKEHIAKKLERALSGSEMLMEANDKGEKMQLYGVIDDNTGSVSDFVLYAPSDCALICIFGSISMETIAKIASND